MPQKYHQRFGIDIGVAEAKRRFVNRFHNLLQSFLSFAWERGNQTEMERHVCTKLGELWTGSRCLEKIIGQDFDKCLMALEALYVDPFWRDYAQSGIKNLLADTEIDIGIRWENGHFLPSGAPALDSALVTDPLNLLGAPELKGVSDAFKKGLDHFLHPQKIMLFSPTLSPICMMHSKPSPKSSAGTIRG